MSRISVIGTGLLDLTAMGADWLGKQSRNAASSGFHTTQLLAGFLHGMNKNGAGALVRERDALATDGTLSLQMTDTLRAGQAHKMLQDMLDAIGARLEGKDD